MNLFINWNLGSFFAVQTNKSFAVFPVQTSRRYETELTALKEERKALSKALIS